MNEELVEHRIKSLEKDMADVKEVLQDMKTRGIDPKIYVAIVGFLGVVFSTLGSVIGTVLTAYIKWKNNYTAY